MHITKKIIIPSILSFVTLSSANAVVLVYDEDSDGDLGAPTSPTSLVLGAGTNTIIGEVGASGDTRDAFSFTLSAGQTLESIILVSYSDPETESLSDGNTGFFNLDEGLVSVIPSGVTSGDLLTGSLISGANNGGDFLDLSNQTDGSGLAVAGELGPGEYTFNIQNTSDAVAYELEFNVVPEPSSTSLLGLSGLFLLMRRRR